MPKTRKAPAAAGKKAGKLVSKLKKDLDKLIPKEDKDKPPLLSTVYPNGQAVDIKYYAYQFHPAEDCDHEPSQRIGLSLAGPHTNVGDLWLRIGRKLIGVRDVMQFCVNWDSETNRLTLWVEWAVRGWVAVGTVSVTDQWVEWRLPNGYPPAVEIRSVPNTPPGHTAKVVVEKPKVDWTKELEVHKPKKGEATVFGHKVSDLVKWMGLDAYDYRDVLIVFAAAGLAPPKKKDTNKLLAAGRRAVDTGKFTEFKVTSSQGRKLNECLIALKETV